MSKTKDEIQDDGMKKVKVSKKEKIENKTVRVFDEILDPNEKILMSLSPEKWKVYFTNLIKPFFVYLIFVMLFFVLFFVKGDGVSKEDALVFLYFISGLILILEVIVILITKKSTKNMYYIFTENRVVASQGLFGYDYKTLEIKHIKDVQLKWSFIDKLCGKKTGQLYFVSDDKSMQSILFYSVEKPLDVYLEIQEILEQNND